MNSILKSLSILFAVTISFSFISSQVQTDPNNIIGKWAFVEMIDQNGKHIDTIKESDGYRVAKDADYVFRSDSTYTAQFSEANTDNGTWTYNTSEKTIILKLYWKKPYDEITQYVISMGHSTKDEKGNYFDLISKKIAFLNSEKLIITNKESYQIIYRKVR